MNSKNGQKTFLKIENILKSYKIWKVDVPVLRGVSFGVKKGEWIALCGASGSGKTTLLNIIGLLERPDSGNLAYEGKAYVSLKEYEKVIFRRKTIGFIFQAYHLLHELTVLENVILAGLLDNKSTKAVKEKALELLDKMGLSDRLNHKPFELSGGEQQRTAIARALINNPSLLLADEPTGNLDSHTGRSIMDILRTLHEENQETSIIMVTHDSEIAGFADKILHLKDGRIEKRQKASGEN